MLTALGVIGAPPVRVVADVAHPLRELAILITAAAATGFVLNRLNMRAAWMFGAMLASGFLHGTNYIHVILPWWVVVGSMIGLGSLTGSRFTNTGWRVIGNYIGAAAGSFFVAVAVAMAFALALVAVSDFHIADVVVSFAPGALDTMMILALTLHFDPLYVGAHHLSRFIVVCFLLPFGVRAIERNNRSRKKPK